MGEINQNVIMDMQDKFEKAQRLMKESDPESEPYKSKYAAAEILTELKVSLTKILDDIDETSSEDRQRFTAMLAAVWLGLGTVSMDTEALSASVEELKKAVELAKINPFHPSFIIVYISSLNHLGILYSMLEQPKISREFLEESEKAYKEFTGQQQLQEAVRIEDLFLVSPTDSASPRSKAESDLEKNHTLTLYYLAQVYGTLEDHLRSAVYCHNTLKRQLESKDYDPIDWALNSATLSQFFMERNGFKQARHHLAAASYILDKYYEEEIKNLEGSEEEIEAKKEQFNHRSSDVARCWAKYGLLLLNSSKERLMAKAADEGEDASPTTDLASQKLPADSTSSHEDVCGLMFSTLEIPTFENQISDKFVLDYEDALPIFHSTKQWLEDAKSYYSLEHHASDFVRITQDHSALFQALIFFEGDDKRQCRMHKRRVDLLENVLSSLNHQCYLVLCRQLWYELGETYWEMLHLKLCSSKVSSDENAAPDPHVLEKLNKLTLNSIANFGNFLDSINGQGSAKGKKIVEPELIRPVLMCHFYRGRLFARIITPNKATQVENNEKSLESFKFIVDYCTEHPEAAKEVALELDVCKEMVELLPHKIARLASQVERLSVS